MAVFPFNVCVVYGRVWFRTQHLRKQNIRTRHIANNNLTKTLLVASLLTVTAWLPVSAHYWLPFLARTVYQILLLMYFAQEIEKNERTRNAVGTRAAGECFHGFFEFSQTFTSVCITR